MNSETISVQGLNTHFYSVGEGHHVCVFLHGWGGSLESFSHLAERLSRESNMRCILVDLPGFGNSDNPPSSGWYLSDYSLWLFHFLKALDLQNPLFYGHSFGCRVLTNFVLRYPEYTNTLILTGAAGVIWPLPFWKRACKYLSHPFRFLKKIIPQRLYFFFLRKILKAHDWADVSDGMKKTFQNTLNEPDVRDLLHRIPNKTLLLWGEKDSYTPIQSAFVFHENLPNATLVIFEEGKHGIHYTHEENIVRAVTQFLDSD